MSKDDLPEDLMPDRVLSKLYECIQEWNSKLFNMISHESKVYILHILVIKVLNIIFIPYGRIHLWIKKKNSTMTSVTKERNMLIV